MKSLLLTALLVTACGQESTSDVSMFFENSTRRNADATEASQTLNAKGCTAFFVENTAGKNLVISARHCFNYAITTWCQNDGRVKDNDGIVGRCTRVVAADANRDIAMFEVSLPYTADAQRGLRLASYSAPVGTRMKMVGYPADQYRRAALTTTENCWILQADTASPHSRHVDRSARHNCTTYGGNSGGPMIAEGSDIALSLPFTYAPGDYRMRNANLVSTSSHMAKMSDFVRAHRSKLVAEGVVIAETSNE